MNGSPTIEIAVVGGSGLYELAHVDGPIPVEVDTPFGPPSAPIVVGRIDGRQVGFLARHGRGHRLLPTELNYRANIYALKSLGAERVISVSAVGSMRSSIHPRDIVVVDQFIDRTTRRPQTFFGDGIAAHVSLADPVCPELRAGAIAAGAATSSQVHDGGTYVCIEGPAFSTRAESELYRSWGVHVIGMTNMQEVRLAREAELCYATLAMVTDYDCWHDDEDDVSVASVLDNLRANSVTAAALIRAVVAAIPVRGAGCRCGDALRHAIITEPAEISAQARERLAAIVGKYLGTSGTTPS